MQKDGRAYIFNILDLRVHTIERHTYTLMALTHHQYTPPALPRIVLTGIGLTSPNANDLASHRSSLLAGKSGVQDYEIRYVGKTLAGICNYDAVSYTHLRAHETGA